jgi:hypothetical protein
MGMLAEEKNAGMQLIGLADKNSDRHMSVEIKVRHMTVRDSLPILEILDDPLRHWRNRRNQEKIQTISLMSMSSCFNVHIF